jgi:site-specific recombinase XerD
LFPIIDRVHNISGIIKAHQRLDYWIQVAPIAATPEVVAQFLEAESILGYSLRTISHRLAAIGHMHRRYSAAPPLLHENGRAIRAALARIGSAQTAQHPMQATTTILRHVLQSIDEDTLEAARDRALLALRIAGAFQISELAALSFQKINREEHKLEILLGRGTPKSGRRNVLTIFDDAVLRPLALLDEWLSQSKIQTGRLFRQIYGHQYLGVPMTKHDVADAIQARALAAGYDGEVLSRINARKSSVSTVSYASPCEHPSGTGPAE